MPDKPTITYVGTTHFDPIWMWSWDEAMASIRGTFRSALDRMREEPRFVYSFSCPPVFDWIRETEPALFREIVRRVREGRWHLVEGWWLQPDCNVASGESYCRQGLAGQRYLKRVFGRRSRTCFNTDSFGHSAQLPQILRKSGIEYTVFGRPSQDQQNLPGPLFRWEGPDGSAVLAFRAGGEGSNQYSFTLDKDARAAADGMERLGHDLIVLYGVSNHGGAPTRESIRQINGLIDDEAAPFRAEYGTPEGFFSRQDASRLPCYRGELQVRDFGVFANHAEVKTANRRGEYELLDAERAAVLARSLAGRACPRATFARAWEDLLFNQFHDIIGGACVKPAYAHVRAVHGRARAAAAEVLHQSLQALTARVDTRGDGYPLVVWNLSSFAIKEPVEAELQWAWEFPWYKGPITLLDESGTPVDCQVIREHSVLPGFRSRIVFRPELPALGYRVFRVLTRGEPEPSRESPDPEGLVLENGRLRVRIDPETGDVAEATDARDGRVLLGSGARAFVRQDDGDTWAFGKAGYGPETGGFKAESCRVVERGAVRTVIRTTARFRDSLLTREYLLYAGADSVDCRFRVEWRERHAVLKLGFDTLLADPEYTVAIPYGTIRRQPDGREMPCGEWVSAQGRERGVSVASDSIFAYDAEGARINLTVLRSPIYGHLTWKEPIDPQADWEFMEQGVREGLLRIVLHTGDWVTRAMPRESAALNNPPLTIDEAAHAGDLPRTASYLSAEGGGGMLTVLKEAEDGGDVVLRLVEMEGRGGEAQVSLPFIDRTFAVSLAPHEIKTLRMDGRTGRRLRETSILEE